MNQPSVSSLVLGLMVSLQTLGATEEWSRFRGPNGTGQTRSSANFKALSDRHVVWKRALPGEGHSSPVHWEDRIFLTSTDPASGAFRIVALEEESGAFAWDKAFPYQPFKKHKFNSFASPTCAVDGDRVFASWGTPESLFLAGLDHHGNLIWKRDLGVFQSQHGPGTSPMLFEDLVIITNEQLGESFIIAVDQKTGETRWKTPRRSAKTAYSTPCLSEDAKGNAILLVNSQAHGIGALNPRTGAPLWEYTNAFDKRSCSSPVIAGGLVFGSCGSGGGGNFLVAVRPPDGRSRTSPELAYEIRRSAPYVPSFLAHGGFLFLWSDGGILSCVVPETGEVKWSERTRGRFFGSPIAVNDQLLAVSDAGKLYVVSGNGTFKIHTTFDLAETCHSTPSVSNGHLFVRTIGHLWKFRSQ